MEPNTCAPAEEGGGQPGRPRAASGGLEGDAPGAPTLGDRRGVPAPPLGEGTGPPKGSRSGRLMERPRAALGGLGGTALDAPPRGGGKQGTPVPPQVFSPGGRMGRPRAAPRGQDGVAQVLPQGDTGARAPQRGRQCAIAVLRGCLEHVRALCDRPLRQVKESPLPLPFPLQKGLCAASPLVFFTSETSPRLPNTTAEGSLVLSFSTLCHRLPQNVPARPPTVSLRPAKLLRTPPQS